MVNGYKLCKIKIMIDSDKNIIIIEKMMKLEICM